MYIYYLLFFAITVGYAIFRHKKDAKITGKDSFLILVFICLWFIMGMKNITVGVDTKQYLFRYENSNEAMQYGFLNPEYGYNAIQYFFHDICGFSFHAYCVIIYFVIVAVLVYFIYRYVDDELIGVSIFVFSLLAMYMSGLRQTLAVSLIILSLVFVEKRRWQLFFPLVAFAFTIHNSAIIFSPMYFVWGLRLNKKQAVIILFTTISALFFKDYLSPIVAYLSPDKYDYIDLYEGYKMNVLVLLAPVIITTFSCIFLGYNGKQRKLSKRDSFFYILSCGYIFLIIMSLNNNQLGRLAYYFTSGMMVICSSSCSRLITNSNERSIGLLSRLFIVVLCWLYFFVAAPGGTFEIDKYAFFWE